MSFLYPSSLWLFFFVYIVYFVVSAVQIPNIDNVFCCVRSIGSSPSAQWCARFFPARDLTFVEGFEGFEEGNEGGGEVKAYVYSALAGMLASKTPKTKSW